MENYISEALRTESFPNDAVVKRMTDSIRFMHGLMGLDTEVGELMDQFKRHIFYGANIDNLNIKEELGDMMWYMAIIMDEVGVNFQECMEANIAKLRARYPKKFEGEAALNRDLDAERKALGG